jgi:aquaporin Z
MSALTAISNWPQSSVRCEIIVVMNRTFVRHWPEYFIEAVGVGTVVIAACCFAIVLFHPDSPLIYAVEGLAWRRLAMGVAMGATAAALVYSPWGKQSGAHFNPAVTLTYYCLGRVAPADALAYILAQVTGALVAIGVMTIVFGGWLSHPAIHYASAMPGMSGATITWLSEAILTLTTMTVVLTASNSQHFARWTGMLAALVTVVNVSLLVPIVGTSSNPARAFATAVPAHTLPSIWIYLTAGPLGMLAAAAIYVRRHGKSAVLCAKLHHQNDKRCIFCQGRVTESAKYWLATNCNPTDAAASNNETPRQGG